MSQNHPQQQNKDAITEEQAVKESFRNSLEDSISILAGIGPLCEDIDQLINMLELALKNDSQLQLIMHHLTPRRMRR